MTEEHSYEGENRSSSELEASVEVLRNVPAQPPTSVTPRQPYRNKHHGKIRPKSKDSNHQQEIAARTNNGGQRSRTIMCSTPILDTDRVRQDLLLERHFKYGEVIFFRHFDYNRESWQGGNYYLHSRKLYSYSELAS